MNTETYKLGEELDSFNHEQVQKEILAILEKGCDAVLDMYGFARVALFQEGGSLQRTEILSERGERRGQGHYGCHGVQ